MFSKRFKRKRPRKKASTEIYLSLSPSLPKTIYLMNVEELRQTAVSFMPKDAVALSAYTVKETNHIVMETTKKAIDVDPTKSNTPLVKTKTDSAIAEAKTEKDQQCSSFDSSSLDELFLQHSMRKPPPKTNSRKRRDSCQDSWTSDSLEMDECTLLSPGLSPTKKYKKNRRYQSEDEMLPSLKVEESPVSLLTGENATDVEQESGVTSQDLLSRNEPDLSFLDDIF